MTSAPAGIQATTTPGPDTRPGPTHNTDWPTRIILGLVMTAALSVGTWSIYTLLTDLFHAPTYVAIFGCSMFDGSAFFFARLSQRYATTTDSGLGPRTAMLAMICTSSWVNWQHAELKHWGTVGEVILAAAPVIAEVAFEMWHKYEHREALRALGRVAGTLPILGKWAWIAHPLRSRKVLDAHIRAGLTETEAIAERRVELAKDRARSIVAAPTARIETALERIETETKKTPVSRPVLDTSRHETRAIETKVSPVSIRETETTVSATGSNETETTSPKKSPETSETKRPETARRDRETETGATKVSSIGDRETETNVLLDLMRSRGSEMKVSLNDAIEETGRPKATAAKRLKAARDLYLAETA